MDSARINISSLVEKDDVTQTKVNLFAKELLDLGMSEEEVEKATMSVAITATNQTTAKISMLMDDEAFDKWKKFLDATPKPNNAQQLIVMNAYLKSKVSKSLEELHLEILDSLMKNTLDDINMRRDLSIKISQMNDEDVDKAMQALDSGDYDLVDDLINSKKGE